MDLTPKTPPEQGAGYGGQQSQPQSTCSPNARDAEALSLIALLIKRPVIFHMWSCRECMFRML